MVRLLVEWPSGHNDHSPWMWRRRVVGLIWAMRSTAKCYPGATLGACALPGRQSARARIRALSHLRVDEQERRWLRQMEAVFAPGRDLALVSRSCRARPSRRMSPAASWRTSSGHGGSHAGFSRTTGLMPWWGPACRLHSHARIRRPRSMLSRCFHVAAPSRSPPRSTEGLP